LYVPVLLLSDPFWDVCVDGGRVGVVEVGDAVIIPAATRCKCQPS
jgi:hypothetical protein